MGDYSKYKNTPTVEPDEGMHIEIAQPEMPEYTAMKLRDFLVRDAGYEAELIDGMMVPGEVVVPPSLNALGLYQDVVRFVDETTDPRVIEETLKIAEALKNDGLELDPEQSTNLGQVLQQIGADKIAGLAEARTWWNRAKREMANEASDFVSGGALNLTIGLSMLDIFERFDKSVKMGFLKGAQTAGKMSEAEIAEIENRVLPTTVIGFGDKTKKFHTATEAGLWMLGQEVLGMGQKAMAQPQFHAATLAKKLGNDSLSELFEKTGEEFAQAGAEKMEFVSGQVPPLIAGLGEPLPWFEVAERSLNAEQQFDNTYKYLSEIGPAGTHAMMGLALGSAALDVFGSPTLAVGASVKLLPKLGRAATTLTTAGKLKAAKITTEAAKRTYRYDDALRSIEASQRLFDDLDGQVQKAVQESVRNTGRARAPRALVAQRNWARRQLNNDKIFFNDHFGEVTAEEALMQVPRKSPKLLVAPKDEFDEARKIELERGGINLADWESAPTPNVQQRAIMGADDAEYAGDGLANIMRTGGKGVEDAAFPRVSPLYHITPSREPIPTIPWHQLDEAGDIVKAERNFINQLETPKLPDPTTPYTVPQSTLRMLVREEQVLRKNLGTARSLGKKGKDKIVLYERKLRQNQRLQKQAKRLRDDPNAHDDVWLPPEKETIMGSPNRFNRWLQAAGDTYVRSLYPGAMRPRYWHSRIGQMHSAGREPNRFYEELDPGTWDMVRSSQMRYTQEVNSWNLKMNQILEQAGIFKKRKNFDPRKHYAPFEVDEEKDRILFELLDEVEGSDEWIGLTMDPKVTPEILEASREIRKVLDLAADSIGIKDSDRYLAGYIRHFFTKDMFANGARPLEFDGLPANAEVFASHLMRRRGAGRPGYVMSAAQALEVYGRAMPRKTILEPMYEQLLVRGDALAARFNNPFLAEYTQAYVRQLKGQPGLLTKVLDDAIGGPLNAKGQANWRPGDTDRAIMGVASMGYLGFLTGNPRYPFMQMATAIPTTSMRYGLGRTMKGLFQYGSKEGQALAKEAGTYQSFINIFENDMWRKVVSVATEGVPSVSPFGVMTNAAAERTIRGMTFWAGIDQYLTKAGFASWDEAVQAGQARSIMYQALRASEEVNHMFGAATRQPIASQMAGHGPIAAGTQFLSFTWKQTDELLSHFGRGQEGIGNIAEYLAVSGWLANVAARDLGIDATQYTGLGYFPERIPQDVTSPSVDFLVNMANVMAAAAEYDPERMSRSLNQMMIDLPVIRSVAEAAEGVVKQAEFSKRGDKLRNLDFASELPDRLEDLTAEDVFRSIRPESDVAPGLGGDLIPTTLGQRGIKETLFRRAQQATRQESKRFAFNERRALENFANATESGDEEEAAKWLAKISDPWRARIGDIGNRLERIHAARNIAWTIRQVEQEYGGDEQMRDLYFKIYRDFGVPVEK